MTDIPKEFLVGEDDNDSLTYKQGFLKPYFVLEHSLEKLKVKREVVQETRIIEDDWLPDGCGIGIGSSYRGL